MKRFDVKENLIIEFLQKKFKNEANIILFGSNKDIYDNNKDIDILIVSNHITSFTKEVFNYKNQIFEIIIIPLFEINTYLEKDKFLKVYVDILTKGKIIVDENNVLKKIIAELKYSSTPNNLYLRKIQLEKSITFFVGKTINSKNIYEAEIYFSKVAENIFFRRLLDFGISNIDSTKYLVDKILIFDFNLVESIYRLKKKLLQLQNASLVILELLKILNIKNIWNNDYYSNRLVLSEIYDNRMVVFIEINQVIEKKIEKLLNNKSIIYYSFVIDKYNINKNGKYYVLLEKKSKLREEIFPLLENYFFTDEDLITNDNKIIFPYLLDIQILLGVTDENNLKILEIFFLYCNEQKSKNKNEVVFFIIYDFLKHLNSNIAIEQLIYIFVGKSNLLNNNFHLNKSQKHLIDLKNKFYSSINQLDEEMTLFSIENMDINQKNRIKIFISKILNNIDNKDITLLYNVLNHVFNLFEIRDYQKPYLIITANKNINNDI